MRKRLLGMAFACVVAFGVSPASVAAAAPTRGKVTTIIAGGWISQPAAIPTGMEDPQHCRFPYQGLVTIHGPFDGLWHEVAMTASCDTSRLPNTMPVTGRGTGTLDVIYAADHTQGTFAWKGIWKLDFVTGQIQGVFDATSSGRDGTFGCSSLHLTFDGYVPPTTAPFGGYTGKWTHVCPK